MCQYTPDNKRTKNTNQTKMCAIMVFYVYFVLYIELLFGNVGLNGSLNKADENTLSNWMVGYSVLGAGFVIPIPSINNYSLSNKKVKIFTTSGWQECTSQPNSVSTFGSGYNVIYNKGLPENLEIGKAFLCQFIGRS